MAKDKLPQLIENERLINNLFDLLQTQNRQIQTSSLQLLQQIGQFEYILDKVEALGGIRILEDLAEQNKSDEDFFELVSETVNIIENCMKIYSFDKDRKNSIKIRQNYQFSDVGRRVWYSGVILARWIFETDGAFLRDKNVIELGSGPGLGGIAASDYARRVTLSDYLPEILDMLKINIDLNHKSNLNLDVMKIDWNDFKVPGYKHETSYEAIIGSDIIFTKDIARMLIPTLEVLLSPHGTFYCFNNSAMVGVDLFTSLAREHGFKVEVATVPETFVFDLPEHNVWLFITCSR